MSNKVSKKRVIMAKRLARKWLENHMTPRFKVRVLCNQDPKQLSSLLYSWRDGRLKLGSLKPLPDLGLQAGFDFIDIWSMNKQAMVELVSYLEGRGYETTGVF